MKKQELRSATAMAEKIKNDPELADKIKEDPVEGIEKLAEEVVKEHPLPTPIMEDFWLYRLVVGSLGAAILSAIIGSLILTGYGKEIPDVVIAIGTASVAAIAALLNPSLVTRN